MFTSRQSEEREQHFSQKITLLPVYSLLKYPCKLLFVVDDLLFLFRLIFQHSLKITFFLSCPKTLDLLPSKITMLDKKSNCGPQTFKEGFMGESVSDVSQTFGRTVYTESVFTRQSYIFRMSTMMRMFLRKVSHLIVADLVSAVDDPLLCSNQTIQTFHQSRAYKQKRTAQPFIQTEIV